jgi:hypothetical protein
MARIEALNRRSDLRAHLANFTRYPRAHPDGCRNAVVHDVRSIPDPLAVENLEAEHGRGIHIMKLAMDQVAFEQRGTEVHMCKSSARNPRVGPQNDSCG